MGQETVIQTLLSRYEASQGLMVTGLKGASFAYLLAQLRQIRKTPALILMQTLEEAEALLSDILFFSPALKNEFFIYPAWEPHPFDTLSPHPDVVVERIEVLYRLLQSKNLCIITTIEALSQRVLPQEVLIEQTLFLKKGREFQREFLFQKLLENGYSKVTSVEDRGTFSIRGGIVDIFPPLTSAPFRLEFVGDEIETLRTFDPASQRSLDTTIEEMVILPVREIIYTDKTVLRAQAEVKRSADEASIKKTNRDQILEYLENKIYFSGIDYFLPFFYPELETVFDLFSEIFDVFYSDKAALQRNSQEFQKECESDHQKALESGRLSCEVSSLYLSQEELFSHLASQKYWNVASLELLNKKETSASLQVKTNEDIRTTLKKTKITSLEILEPLARQLKTWRSEGQTLFFIAHTQTQLKRFRELFSHYGIHFFMMENFSFEKLEALKKDPSFFSYEVLLVLGSLSCGFQFSEEKVIFITEEEIFGQRRHIPQPTAAAKKGAFITSLSELKLGDPVVHVDHGIGLYRGLERLQLGGSLTDTMLIEYADRDKLYVPLYRLNVIQTYVGGQKETLRLDKLGGMQWAQAKKKAKKIIEQIAHELLDIYAARKAYVGFSFSPADSYFHELEATFPYDETPDQLKTLEEILSDMCSPKPMDRIVCGDVGYGKTEVAIRAAFKAVMDKKQVAVLAPTTLLVDQHTRVFQERLKQFPVVVDSLSRFRSSSEQKETLQKLKKGEVDIVIGTHRLLSQDIAFSDLGLLIIDEEQRFGVTHKEKIKKMKKMLDVLTLSATPIPRTLHMALLGIRDISIINTPPQDRLSIRTYLTEFQDQTIREAILQEVRRGGQVFFIHNRVETIARLTGHLQKLVPEAKIHFAHGQMAESAIEKIMLDFLAKKFNVLVSTTIVGSGIDISSANTILIDRADTFGLAQLYQLRGRVGRSRDRAYAYLLIPSEEKLTPDAKKRLQVIQGASELGSGFKIASHDLEIRGGGNILGKDQSGHIEAIGFELYTDLLEQTVRELKGEAFEEAVDPELNLKVDAYIPEDYMPDMSDKLSFYRQLSSLQAEEDLADVEADMRDRFGPLPPVIFNLFEIMAIKLYLKKLKAHSIDVGNQKAVFTFLDQTPLSPQKMIEMVQKNPRQFQIKPGNKFVVTIGTWKEILPFVRGLTDGSFE